MKRLICSVFTFTIILMLGGCFNKAPVCHIASDISLIIPNQTTKQEILAYLGPPAQKRSVADNQEEWLYFQPYDSILRKTPFIGKKMGECEYDMATILFTNDVVSSRQYRDLSEAEFKQLGIPDSVPK